jgi:hypothetical protein
MYFDNNFYNTVSALINMEIFSNLLTSAVSANASIQPVHTKDSLEPWGVSKTNHEYCYGRHLYYNSPNNGNVLFWIGLDITQNDTYVTLTFDRKTLDAFSLTSKVTALPTGHSELPSHCKAPKSDLIERRLVNSEFRELCKNNNPKVLKDFLNEVLNVL